MTPPDLDTPSRPPQSNLPTREPRDMVPLFQVAAQSLQNFANPAAPDERPAIISRIPRYTAPCSSWPTWTQPVTTVTRAPPRDPPTSPTHGNFGRTFQDSTSRTLTSTSYGMMISVPCPIMS